MQLQTRLAEDAAYLVSRSHVEYELIPDSYAPIRIQFLSNVWEGPVDSNKKKIECRMLTGPERKKVVAHLMHFSMSIPEDVVYSTFRTSFLWPNDDEKAWVSDALKFLAERMLPSCHGLARKGPIMRKCYERRKKNKKKLRRKPRRGVCMQMCGGG